MGSVSCLTVLAALLVLLLTVQADETIYYDESCEQIATPEKWASVRKYIHENIAGTIQRLNMPNQIDFDQELGLTYKVARNDPKYDTIKGLSTISILGVLLFANNDILSDPLVDIDGWREVKKPEGSRRFDTLKTTKYRVMCGDARCKYDFY
jgi:hypothetical protein